MEIVSYGLGHTESDLFAHIPDADLVVLGDLLWVGHHPRVNDGDPLAWASVLDRIDGLGVATAVPGHGTVGGKADADYMAGYLRTVADLVDEARTRRPRRRGDRRHPGPGRFGGLGQRGPLLRQPDQPRRCRRRVDPGPP